MYVAFKKRGVKKKVIYTLCWPWQSIGCDDHNLRVTVWYMATHSLIHLFHASIYPRPHLVSVFALNLFLDYLNQLPPCTCQTLSCPGSSVTLYLIQIAGLWPACARREEEGRSGGGGKERRTVLFIRGVGNSCIHLRTVNLCCGTIHHRLNGVKIKGTGGLASILLNPTTTY